MVGKKPRLSSAVFGRASRQGRFGALTLFVFSFLAAFLNPAALFGEEEKAASEKRLVSPFPAPGQPRDPWLLRLLPAKIPSTGSWTLTADSFRLTLCPDDFKSPSQNTLLDIHLSKEWLGPGMDVLSGDGADEYFDAEKVLDTKPDRLNILMVLSEPVRLKEWNLVNVSILSPEEAPDKAFALAPLDMVVLDAPSMSRLRPEQRISLLLWARSGGILLVGAGEGGAKTLNGSFLASCVGKPIKGEVRTRDLSSLIKAYERSVPERVEIGMPDFRSDADASAVRLSGNPIYIRRGIGRGELFVCGLDPLGPLGLRNWDGWPLLIREMNGASSRTAFEKSPYAESVRILTDKPRSASRALFRPALVIFLVASLLTIGHRLLVLRRRKGLLVWALPPLAALITLLFAMGMTSRGETPLEISVLGLTDIRAKEGVLFGWQEIVVEGDKASLVSLKTAGDDALIPVPLPVSTPPDRVEIEMKKEGTTASFRVRPKVERVFRILRQRMVKSPVESDVVLRSEFPEGTIRNVGDEDMTLIGIAWGASRLKTGRVEMKPGEALRFAGGELFLNEREIRLTDDDEIRPFFREIKGSEIEKEIVLLVETRGKPWVESDYKPLNIQGKMICRITLETK